MIDQELRQRLRDGDTRQALTWGLLKGLINFVEPETIQWTEEPSDCGRRRPGSEAGDGVLLVIREDPEIAKRLADYADWCQGERVRVRALHKGLDPA